MSAVHRYILLPTDEFFHGYGKKKVDKHVLFKSAQFVFSRHILQIIENTNNLQLSFY